MSPHRARLCVDPNLDDPDALFERLVAMHDKLVPERSAIVSSKLILLLANHIGDLDVIDDAIRFAREPEQT